MQRPFELSGPNQPPLAGGKPRHLVVLLHGYGSDGNDLIGLAPHWARRCRIRSSSRPCALSLRDGGFGHQWFSFDDRAPAAILAGTKAAANILMLSRRGAGRARGLTDRDSRWWDFPRAR
jgi:Phospholipase/Carboxylesterase.